ncbi:lipopolysaccharide biosynthesis protein [Vibrio nomapromontoriensis]|uniref:lipopolysaccharide biosynthesis protein n=1 Tax=Vibrio nomapromontoriensis TaxID=2910246 RepID=UPI003D1199C7
MQSEPVTKVKTALLTGIWATLVSIVIGFTFKVWLAGWMAKSELTLFHTVVDIISLSMILMSGFRSSMVVAYSQTQNDIDIINIFRFTLIFVVLITWGGAIPYIKHSLDIGVEYIQLVGIIFGLGLKLYFTNLISMYRLYSITNRTTWLDPTLNVLLFFLGYYLVGFSALTALFYGLSLSSLMTALYMYIKRKKTISTFPFKQVHLNADMFGYVKKSVTATLEAGASILMIYIAVLLTVSYFSVDELGDFQVVVRPIFTYMTMLFVFPIYRFVLPELSVKVRNGEYCEILMIRRWVFKLSFIVSGIFFVTMLLFGSDIVGWLYPEEYSNSVPLLFYFSMFFVFMMLNAYQLTYIKANGYFKTSLFIRLLGIVTMVVMFYLISALTSNVAAIIVALCLGYVMMFILSSFKEKQIRQAMLATNGIK